MQHLFYFKDWLIQAVTAVLHDDSDMVTLERLHEHTLSLTQCERMAIEATEREEKLCYMESRREHLWHLLQMGMTSTSVPGRIVDLPSGLKSNVVPVSTTTTKSTQKKRSEKETVQTDTSTLETIVSSPESKKRQIRKTKESTVVSEKIPQDR